MAGNPIGSFPFTPGVDNPFNPGDSRVTNASFNGVAGDVLSFQANPGGANSQIQLVRASNNATVIATIAFSATATHTITAAEAAQFPYQLRITNNSTVNQSYVIGCTAGATQPAPTVSGINPSSGTTAGGTAVVISGTNFTGVTAVSIGGITASFTVVNATTINATTPAHAAGVVNIAVTTPGGTGTGVGLFTYIAPPAAPTVTAINPTSGSTAGGTAVTITGTNFTGATAVTIGGAAVTNLTVVSSTSITATTPPHGAGIVDVVVTAPGGTGTGVGLFTYVAPPAAPTVTAVNPPRGVTSGGTAITITGTNFTGATGVTIGGVAATSFTVVSATSITATTPAHAAGLVDLVVTTPNGSGTGVGLFTFVAPQPPTVTGISPASGPTAGGTSVTISGTTFVGATSVTIGGTAATFTVVNATTINATTPAHGAGVFDVVVVTPGGTGTGAGLFTYVAPPGAPSVASVSPASGPSAGGTSLTISGANFTGASAVTIGGTPATTFSVVNDTTITATTPAHAAGLVDVTVTTSSGSGTGSGLFTFIPPGPTITTVSPPSGPTAGGTSITITGTDFTGATSVTIGGVAAVSFTVVSASSIAATTPAHAAGAVNVDVTTAGGTGTGVGLFTYVTPPPAPTVTAINPATGSTVGGEIVTITGASFTDTSAVTFDGIAGTSVTVVSPTSITVTTPAHAEGPVDVAVTTQNGTGTGAGLFTYVAPAATPTVTAISPATGSTAGGTQVTITGSNFTGATNVTIGGVAATNVAVVSAMSITATTPAHAAGDVDVSVTTPSGTGTGAGLFTFVAPQPGPIVTSVSPASGPSAGGTVITIVGTNFTGVTAVTIGGVSALSFTFASDTTITATTAAHAAGVVDVSVTTANGTGAGAGLFTYVAPAPTPTKAIEAIAGFLGRRNMLLAMNEPDSNREIDRLLGTARSDDHAESLLQRDSRVRLDATARSNSLAPVLDVLSPSNAQMVFRAGRDIGPPRIDEGWSDARNWQFSTSLGQISDRYAVAQARRAAEAGYRLGVAGSGGRSNPFDVWIEGTYADFSDDGFASNADGHFGLVSLGADYVVNSRLLVGAMGQYDTTRERSVVDSREVEGQGWMVGPYATMRLGDGVFWRVRAAWGRSSNDVRPFLTYTDHFDSDRWLISSRLTGNLEAGRWTVRPSASVFYIEDTAESYVDGDGATVPEVRSRLGQVAAGPEVSYRYNLNDLQLEPHLALSVAATFANEAEAAGLGRLDGAIVGRDDVRTRAEIGLRGATRGGLTFDVTGAYDGIGSDGFEAYSARFTLRVPMN